jgi:twitching motility protein PilT
MARVDSLLSIVVDQGANELRIGTDREPKMLAYGIPKRLNIPAMSEDMVRELMGDILSADREAVLRTKGRVEAQYLSEKVGGFQVTMTARPDGVDAVFLRVGARSAGQPSKDAALPSSPAILPPGSAPLSVLPSGASPPSRTAPLGSSAVGPLASEPRAARGGAAPSEALVRLLARAQALGASDLHLSEGDLPSARVTGDLRRFDDEPPISIHEAFVWEGAAEAHLAGGGSLDVAADIPELGRVRMHLYATSKGTAASLRLLPKGAPSLSSLALPLPLDELALLPNGLVLVCGATGSGKSTTLAAIAQEALRRRSILLVTLEDPIEYALVASPRSLLRRRWIGRDAPDFASALRDALREDPDVLLVGEMRDPETISLALTAAETGHLVLSSIHSRGAVSAIERIVDAYPPERQRQVRVQLAEALRAIVAQRLLPRARGGGRVVAIEILRATRAVASLVREGKTEQITTALQSGRREGMITLERCLADMVQSGEIRADDARSVANDPESLAAYLGK